jgi:phosphatidate cytidylyltransferase
MTEQQGPDGGADDLFEDLDKFFSSIDEDEWPEPIVPSAPSAEPSAPEAPAEEDVVPPTAAAVPAGADMESEQAPDGPGFDVAELSPPAGPSQPPTEPAQPPVEGRPDDMTREDWSRLRDVLGDEEAQDDEVAVSFAEEPDVTTEDSLFGYPGEDVTEEGVTGAMSETWETGRGDDAADEPRDEPGELTLDDLRKAPPQYRDLPGPPDEPFESAPPASPPPPELDEPGLGSEPSLADVEAAADRVAGEFSPPPRPSEPTGPGYEGAAQGDSGSSYEEGSSYGRDSSWLPGELSDEADEVPGALEDDLLADLAEPRGPRRVKVGEPESLLGPAWEDPTARTVGSEPRGPRISGRNVPVAVASAVVLAVVALIALAWKASAFAVVAGAVVLIAQFELYTTTQRRGYHPAIALGLILGGLTLAGAYLKGEPAMAFVIALGLVLTFLWFMSAPPKARSGSLANIGVTLFGLLYVPFLASFALLILTEAGSGRALMLAVIGLTFLYDVAAFFVGSFYGSRPLAPTISPKKSWEGLAAATLLTFAISLAFVSRLGPMDVPKALGLALVIVVFAPLGDLAESAVKRDLGVKDMGSIMPGHGGALDRIDSVLFVAPAAFYFLRLVF